MQGSWQQLISAPIGFSWVAQKQLAGCECSLLAGPSALTRGWNTCTWPSHVAAGHPYSMLAGSKGDTSPKKESWVETILLCLFYPKLWSHAAYIWCTLLIKNESLRLVIFQRRIKLYLLMGKVLPNLRKCFKILIVICFQVATRFGVFLLSCPPDCSFGKTWSPYYQIIHIIKR